MRQMFRSVVRKAVDFAKKSDGPSAVEYAVLLALIVVVSIGAITQLGSATQGTFQAATAALPSGS